MPFIDGIPVKKQYGQHFLRWQPIVDSMIAAVSLNDQSSVFEIGCGDGFLTRSIINQPLKQLWVFEIDPDWAQYVQIKIKDKRLTIFQENILDVDFSRFENDKPWTLLANLPYQITFPLLHLFQKNRSIFKEGVIMVQEEVAEKLLKNHGRGYGYPSLFFQHYFEWKKLDKVPPIAFEPPPKVESRLLYFKPKAKVTPIKDEPAFWEFIKLCFRQPRRTLKNNLEQTHFDMTVIDEKTLQLRAQQMTMDDFLALWKLLG
jgi:16S rRNA (adenine1518-N6/adenine1519-N6)-dimethyltransferase